MKNGLIYDIPTRFFHWLFAFLFITSFFIAKNIDDESVLFSYHMLSGFVLVLLVIVRIIWGFFGSKYSKFSHFSLKPIDLIKYFKSYFLIDRPRWVGHNPASSWVSLIMMFLALGLGITGYLMVSGEKETYEDIHELLANSFLVIAIIHILGVTIESIRLKHMIGFSMVHGKKSDVLESDEISHGYKGIAALFLFLILSFSFYLYKNFNTQTGVLSVFNQQLEILEIEEEE